ncbi:MAG: cupin domain-containing protein [Pseudomonadota bacterium]
MDEQILTFRELVAPIDPEVFLRDYYGKKPLHIPGAAEKFAKIFSWDQLNELLARSTLWSDRSFELASGGRLLRAEDYCYAGVDREGKAVKKPDPARVQEHLRAGATLALDFIELQTSGLRSLAQTLEVVTGAQITASMFCSWQKTQGYASHFDVQNVFACHISGTKTWRIFEGRFPHAADLPGAHRDSFPQSHHEKTKGALLQEVHMTPGDLLYIPHGQYHDALSSSEAAMHVSFGTLHLVVHDFLEALLKDLPKDPLFRAHLPALDDLRGQQRCLEQVAGRLAEIIRQPQIAKELRDFMAKGAFERIADYRLPERASATRYRVRWPGMRLNAEGNGWRLSNGAQEVRLEAQVGAIAEWAMARDFFSAPQLAAALPEADPGELEAGLARLGELSLIEPI